MSRGEAVFSDLVGHLYDAAIDHRLWTGTASRIAAIFDSSSAVVKSHGGDGHVHLHETTDNLVVSRTDQAWADHWHCNDLWVDRSVALGLSRVVTSHDLVSADEEKRSPFYQEWLRQVDIHHMVGAAFPAGSDRIGVLGIHRPREAGRFADTDRRKVGLLLPHLQRALHLGRHLAAVSLAQAAALDALDRLDTGVLVIDRSRRVVHANAPAESILCDNGEVGVRNGRLFIRDRKLDRRLVALVREAVDTALGDLSHGRSALAVPRDDRSAVTLTLAPLRPRWSRFDGQQPLALVFIRDPDRLYTDPDRLRDVFGLTHAEAALATDLARGAPLAEVAKRRRIGIETVRSHLKKILAKTGTHRQAEAVSVIARSVGTVADGEDAEPR